MNYVKSKQRVADHGEVFTPAWMVEAMLDLVKDETERIDSRFLEPASGSGNFLVQILRRKLAAVELKYGRSDFERRHYALLALMCIYGIELLSDNIAECRANLLEILEEYLNVNESDEFYRTACWVLSQNLVHGDALTMRTHDGQPITFAEWGYLGKGRFQRRDFRLDALSLSSTFSVIIGNPPYQLGQSGGDSVGSFAMPIYQKFVQAAKQLDPRYVVMVTPSRWFAGGRGLDAFRQEMLESRQLRSVVDFPNAADAFPGIDIAGGVSYFLWDRLHSGPCEVRTVAPGVPEMAATRELDAYDIFVRYNVGVSILQKVWAPHGVTEDSLARKVSPTQPFGLRTAFRGKETPKGMQNPVKLRTSEGDSFIERADVPRNDAWIDQWKVILGLAYGERGSFPYWITAEPDILGPGTVCTETYLVVDRFDSEKRAKLFAGYLRTRFVRFLISLRKNTQHLYSERFAFVPDLPINRLWTDEALYAKYRIDQDEIAFIKSMVRPMDESDE